MATIILFDIVVAFHFASGTVEDMRLLIADITVTLATRRQEYFR